MKNEQNQVREFMVKAGQETPAKPCIPSEKVQILRAKLILEETTETIHALGCFAVGNVTLLDDFSKPDLVKIADGIADLIVVALGTAVACGIDMEPIWQEVHRSNMSKFIDGYKREDGKWVKGPSYSPANLGPIIEEQSK